MGKHTKAFIDRKSAVSFRLAHRSQKDPLIADGLRMIDDHFETLFDTQYAGHNSDEENDGEEDDEGRPKREGATNSMAEDDEHHFLSLLEEEEGKEGRRPICEQRFQRQLPDTELKGAVLRYAVAVEHRRGELTEDILVDSAKRSRWDCESILSTRSTLYNHPTMIREPKSEIGGGRRKKKPEKGMAKLCEEMGVDGDDRPAAVDPPSSVCTRISLASTMRPKGETAEERRKRKNAVKEERRERRKEKKVNKENFRAESLRLEEQRKSAQRKTRPIQ